MTRGVQPLQSRAAISVFGDWFDQRRVLGALDDRAGHVVERKRF